MLACDWHSAKLLRCLSLHDRYGHCRRGNGRAACVSPNDASQIVDPSCALRASNATCAERSGLGCDFRANSRSPTRSKAMISDDGVACGPRSGALKPASLGPDALAVVDVMRPVVG